MERKLIVLDKKIEFKKLLSLIIGTSFVFTSIILLFTILSMMKLDVGIRYAIKNWKHLYILLYMMYAFFMIGIIELEWKGFL